MKGYMNEYEKHKKEYEKQDRKWQRHKKLESIKETISVVGSWLLLYALLFIAVCLICGVADVSETVATIILIILSIAFGFYCVMSTKKDKEQQKKEEVHRPISSVEYRHAIEDMVNDSRNSYYAARAKVEHIGKQIAELEQRQASMNVEEYEKEYSRLKSSLSDAEMNLKNCEYCLRLDESKLND